MKLEDRGTFQKNEMKEKTIKNKTLKLKGSVNNWPCERFLDSVPPKLRSLNFTILSFKP